MNRLLARILIGLILLSSAVAPSYAIIVNKQNQFYAQPAEKITVTYLSVSTTHRGEICSIYTPTSHITIDTTTSHVGDTVTLGSFSKDTEIIFQLMDPHTGFCFYNDPRNNIDLANHMRITDLGQGKWLIGWQHDDGNGNYSDLVIMVQQSSDPPSKVEQKSAASSWQLYQ